MTLPSDRPQPSRDEIQAWIASFGPTEIRDLIAGSTARRFPMLKPDRVTEIAAVILEQYWP